jgi:hypothetical protein
MNNCKCTKNSILSITKGNDFTLLLDLTRKLPAEDSVAEPVVESTTDVCLLTSCGKRITVPRTAEAHVLGWTLVTVNDRQQLAITIPSSVQQIDSYGLEVKGIANGDNWRFKAKPGETFNIVDTTNEQNIPDDQVMIYNMCYMIGIGSQNQDMTGYATQQWVRDQHYLIEHQSLIGYATQQWVREQHYLTEHQSLSGYATEQWVNEQNFLKQHQDISGKENRMQIVVPDSLTFLADTGKYYRITQSGTITVTLPSVVSNYLEGFLLFFTAASDDCLHFDTQDTVIFADGYETKAGDICDVNAVYNGDGWQITLIKFNS